MARKRVIPKRLVDANVAGPSHLSADSVEVAMVTHATIDPGFTLSNNHTFTHTFTPPANWVNTGGAHDIYVDTTNALAFQDVDTPEAMNEDEFNQLKMRALSNPDLAKLLRHLRFMEDATRELFNS